MSAERRRSYEADLEPGRSYLALILVTASILSLLAAPLLVERRIDGVRSDISELMVPMRSQIGDVQVELVTEVAAIRGYAISGDARFVREFREAVSRQERSLTELRLTAERVSPEAMRLVQELERSTSRYLEVPKAVVDAELPRDAFGAVLTQQDDRLQEVLADLTTLERTRASIEDGLRNEIDRTEGLSTKVTILLSLLGLGATIAVAGLVRGHRSARASLARAATEEAGLRQVLAELTAFTRPEDVLRRIAADACGATSAEGAYIETVDLASGEVVVAASAGSGTPPVGTRVAYAGSMAEEVLTQRAPAGFEDLRVAERAIARHLPAESKGGNGLVVPLVSEDRPLGALILFRRPGDPPFAEREVDRIRVRSDLAALALGRALLLSEAQHRGAELQRLYNVADQARREAEQGRIDLAEAMEGRSRLMRGFSHDLKNPLGAADGFLQLLDEGIMGELTPRQRTAVGGSRRAMAAALRLIDDLLELARARSSELHLDFAPTDLGRAIEELALEYHAIATAKGLELSVSVDPSLPSVQTDSARVRQILGNLLSNAVKYTHSGRVVVAAEVRWRDAADSVRCVAVDVTDSGPGIPADQQHLLFQEFKRLTRQPEPGAGLGLAISQRLAQALGGDISVNSVEGKGSTFTLWLPARSEEARSRDGGNGDGPPRRANRADAAAPREGSSPTAA
jgi:signal transduction histidine kinase/CHASE3 domain sensor protein